MDRTFPLAGVINLTTPVQVGYHWDRYSLSLGIYLAYGALGSQSHYGDEQLSWSLSGIGGFQLAPTLRYHFTDLRPGALVPYLQAEVDWAYYFTHQQDDSGVEPNAGQHEDPPVVLGAALTAGAEYLVSEHFGLSADITLRYLFARTGSQHTSGQYTHSSSTQAHLLAVGGTAGIVLHF